MHVEPYIDPILTVDKFFEAMQDAAEIIEQTWWHSLPHVTRDVMEALFTESEISERFWEARRMGRL